MWGLLLTTILASAADSFNPIGITQQFVLQGMVKKPKDIWYFIIPTGVVNLITGYLAYYGLITLISGFFGTLVERYGRFLYTAELILGIAFLIAIGFVVKNYRKQALKMEVEQLKTGDGGENNDEAEAAHKIKSVAPMALIALGVGATISELTTALPYFAFLAVLYNYHLTVLEVSIILIVYNIIYMSPLMVMYFIYVKAQEKFDRFYHFVKTVVVRWASFLLPCVMGIIGVILVYHSISLLTK